MIVIMKLPCPSNTSVSLLLFLVVAWGSGVRGQPCPSGQITHIDGKEVKCCLPTDCKPNHYLKYCEDNGTADTCVHCPRNYGLFKRTSSFAVEPCHNLLVKSHGPRKCKSQSVKPSDAEKEDQKNCYCDLEKGDYFKVPQVPLGPSSYCQPYAEPCSPGYQPTQKGICEPCPPNTVQDQESFRLCRPQTNCTALRLETKIPGNSKKESVCAEPPPLPSTPTVPGDTARTPTASRTPKSTMSVPTDASVRPNVHSESDAPLKVVVAVGCSVVLICLALFVFFGRRREWFTCIWRGRCQTQDIERHSSPGSQTQLSSHDNDNTSDNSCYTCADSCLTTSNKNNSNAAGKSAASTSDQTKTSRPLPMLEAFMNMNGKCTHSLSSNGSLSEPFYNSIGQDERLKASGDNLPSYKNTNGLTPSMVRQDLHQYPNRVHLTSGEEDDSMQSNLYAQVQPRAAKVKERREPDDFTATDPLLANSENCSSGIPTPVGTPALRGILRNGYNRRDPKQGGTGTHAAREGAGGSSGGNRPHLSMLLNSAEDSQQIVTEDSQAVNLPHLSQLVSAQRSTQAPGQQPPPQLQHQQLLQQQAPQPQPQGHDPRPQMPQQGSPLAARLIPVSSATQQPPLDPSLVQMEELKPVLPLSPGPPLGTSPSSPMGDSGAGPQSEERTGSPAHISLTQEEVKAKGCPGNAMQRPGLNDGAAVDHVKKDVNGKALAKQAKKTENSECDEGTVKDVISEETLRKQADLNAASGSEDTMQKSGCGSSGLGDSLDFSSPLDLPPEEDGRSRTMYRRSNSEASRSVSPPHQLPPSRSISTPEEKHRPFAVVKPMQSDQSLNAISASQLTQQLDAAGRQFPLSSLCGRSPGRQSSQEASGDSEETRPKTPDNLSGEEENDSAEGDRQEENEGRTQGMLDGDSDDEQDTGDAAGQDKGSDGNCAS